MGYSFHSKSFYSQASMGGDLCKETLQYEVSQISQCDLEVILSTSTKEKIVLTTITELLPLAFGPLDLGIDIAKYQK